MGATGAGVGALKKDSGRCRKSFGKNNCEMGKVGLGSSFNSFSLWLDERMFAYRDDVLMAPKWQFDDTAIASLHASQ